MSIGKAGRKTVEEKYSLLALRNNYLQVFNDVKSA
jgi:hypothetical protein